MLNSLFSAFSLSASERALCLALAAGGPARASALARQIGISRPTAYDLLSKLIERGLAQETQQAGRKLFVMQTTERLRAALDDRAQVLNQAKSDLTKLERLSASATRQVMPRLQLFQGRTALRQMMRDLLLYRDITALAYWPIRQVMATLGAAWLREFHQERQRRNIALRAIWPQRQVPKFSRYGFLAAGPEWKREVRLAQALDFRLGFTIYGNTVRFLSSRREALGFLIESQELTEVMRCLFELAWARGKPLSARKSG